MNEGCRGGEAWADGYSVVEFERTALGLIPYHQEFRPSPEEAAAMQPLPVQADCGPGDQNMPLGVLIA